MDIILNSARSFVRSNNDEPARPSREEAEAAVRTLLAYVGDDPTREGLVDTPKRVVKAYREVLGGYHEDPGQHLQRVFEEVGGYDDMVLLRDVSFTSFCEHHMLPFIGKAHVAYYPREGVVGLSKIARVVDIFARRLQTQEKLSAEIVATLNEYLAPRGIALMMEAEHKCMAMRGIRKAGVSTVTTQFTGVFRSEPAHQERFISMVRV